MSIEIIKPPNRGQAKTKVSVFLAGSIEMGKAEDWQKELENTLTDFQVTVFNPRADSWDNNRIQRESDCGFNEQVNWELDRLDESDIIFMYLSPGTTSPISLLELGLYADSNKMLVCCPVDFYRRGNVEIVCSRHNIPIFDNLEESKASLISKLKLKLKLNNDRTL